MKKIIFLALIFAFFVSIFFINKEVSAYGECDQYGLMAIYDGFNSCKCMSGYSFGKDFMGQTSCISDYQLCKDKYGYNATSNFSGGCKCNYGYAFGKDSLGRSKCVSLDSICEEDLGYNSSYNSLYDKCECSYGYIIRGGTCVSGDSYCRSEHGIYSDYNTSSSKCECDYGYTFGDDGQCVEKQNNVYFILKELDTDNKKAIIKSEYDYSYYSITYNSGCYATSFKRYLNHQIVVNLGTDFSLDTWDKIVLQDDDEVCDITRKEKVDYSFSLEEEEDSSGLTLEQLIAINELNKENTITTSINTPQKPKISSDKTDTQIKKEENKIPETIKTEQKDEVTTVVSPESVKKIKWYKKIINWFRGK